MKIVVKIISYIFTFILMLALFAGIVLGITTKTVLNQEYVLAKLEETNYYEKVYNSLLTQLEDYMEQSGLAEIDLQNVLKKEQVKTDVDNLFIKLYNGDQVSVKQTEVAQQLESNLEEEIKEKGITLTTTEKKAIDQIINTVAKTYTSEVSYGTYSKYLDSASKLLSIVDKALFVAGLVLYALPVIVAVILLLFNFNQFRIGLKYLGIAAVANGGLMIGLNIFTKVSMDLQNLFILNKATSDLIIKIATEFLSNITTAGIISIGIGILFIILGATYQKKEEKDEDEEVEE